MGQTVAFRIGPRGHTWWQRTVTYPIPEVPSKADEPFLPALLSNIWILVGTLLPSALIYFIITQSREAPDTVHQAGLLLVITNAFVILYIFLYGKRVGQDRQRLKAPQDTP